MCEGDWAVPHDIPAPTHSVNVNLQLVTKFNFPDDFLGVANSFRNLMSSKELHSLIWKISGNIKLTAILGRKSKDLIDNQTSMKLKLFLSKYSGHRGHIGTRRSNNRLAPVILLIR